MTGVAPLEPLEGQTASVTRDTFWHGRLAVWQPARGHGYRFNLDPVALARFCPKVDVAVELGAGCGILSLLLLASSKAHRVTAVEVQPKLAALIRRNAADNGLEGRLTVIETDLRQLDAPRAALVAFNPPYYRQGEGRASPDPGRDAARREQHGTLADFVACARQLVVPDGIVAAVIPSARALELRGLCVDAGLHPCASQAVAARPGVMPHLALMRFAPQPPSQAEDILPTLCVHAGAGRDFSAEMAPWVDGAVAAPTSPWP